VGLELDSVFAQGAELGEGENLESTGIGEDRAVPAHELVEPAELAHDFVARPEVQVVRVSEDHGCAHLDEIVGI